MEKNSVRSYIEYVANHNKLILGKSKIKFKFYIFIFQLTVSMLSDKLTAHAVENQIGGLSFIYALKF